MESLLLKPKHFYYDEAGRLYEEDSAGQLDFRYVYDERSLNTYSISGDGKRSQNIYDQLGHKLETQTNVELNHWESSIVLAYSYDDYTIGRITSKTYNNGEIYHLKYTRFGEVESEIYSTIDRDPGRTEVIVKYGIEYDYYRNGLLKEKTDIYERIGFYIYNPDSPRAWFEDIDIFNHSYTYNILGLETSYTYNNDRDDITYAGNGVSLHYAFTWDRHYTIYKEYNAAGRLTKLSKPIEQAETLQGDLIRPGWGRENYIEIVENEHWDDLDYIRYKYDVWGNRLGIESQYRLDNNDLAIETKKSILLL